MSRLRRLLESLGIVREREQEVEPIITLELADELRQDYAAAASDSERLERYRARKLAGPVVTPQRVPRPQMGREP